MTPDSPIRLYGYRLRLRQPIAVRGRNDVVRDGVLIQVSDPEGHAGWGEVAPLPGLSRETGPEAARALARLSDPAPGPASAAVPRILDGSLLEAVGPLPPSARFGLETALLSRWTAVSGQPLRRLLPENGTGASVNVNALLPDSGPAGLRRARDWAEAGGRCFKVKVGAEDPAGEAGRLRNLAAALPSGCRFRPDANRAWTLDQADRFLRALRDDVPLDYLEEPLADPADLETLARRAPVALDESFRDQGDHALARCPSCVAVVLKPGIRGGISETLTDVRAIQEHGARVVFSSAFASGVGTRVLAELAAAVSVPDEWCGLDPYGWLAEDVLEPGLVFRAGRLDLAALDREPPRIRMDQLTPWSDHG